MRPPADEGQEVLGGRPSQDGHDISGDEQDLPALELKFHQRFQELKELRQLPLDDDIEMIIGISTSYD